jgi:hypothetical protein
MALHVEEVSVGEGKPVFEFVSEHDDGRWEELEQRGLVAPESDALLIWYDEVVMLSGSLEDLRQWAHRLSNYLE